MPNLSPFDAPSPNSAFEALVDRRPARLLDAVREIAAELDPSELMFDLDAWLAARVSSLSSSLPHAGDFLDRLALVSTAMLEAGLAQAEADYDRVESSLPHYVAETGRGLPIIQALLYADVAESCGVTLDGVSSPAHYLLRFNDEDCAWFVDAYRGGELLDEDGAVDRISQLSGMEAEVVRPLLTPAKPRVTLERYLSNIRRVLLTEEDWVRLYAVQRRLCQLAPADVTARCDLAGIAASGPAPQVALDLLPGLLRDGVERRRAAAIRDRAERVLAAWN